MHAQTVTEGSLRRIIFVGTKLCLFLTDFARDIGILEIKTSDFKIFQIHFFSVCPCCCNCNRSRLFFQHSGKPCSTVHADDCAWVYFRNFNILIVFRFFITTVLAPVPAACKSFQTSFLFHFCQLQYGHLMISEVCEAHISMMFFK